MNKISLKKSMIRKNRIILTVLFLLFAQNAFTQNMGDVSILPKEYIPSPQSWAFMKYGNSTVNYYNGQSIVNIPIYTYTDKDFNIPISISNVSEGFIPYLQTGILGLNWHLNAGGMITREIRGNDDFAEGVEPDGEGKGFLITNNKFSDVNLLNLTPETGVGYSNYFSFLVGPAQYNGDEVNMKKYGSEPHSDIYHFRIPGHSGTFHFDGNRNAKVYNTNGNHGTYKIERNDDVLTLAGDRPKFKITTGDGYQYFFGGEEEYYERSLLSYVPFYSSGDSRIADMGPFTTMMLKKIVAPNGRSVLFEYDVVNGSMGYSWSSTWDQNRNNNFIVSPVPALAMELYGNSWNYLTRRINIIKTTYLKKIVVPDVGFEISFDYSPKMYAEGDPLEHKFNRLVQKLLKLDKITVSKQGSTPPLKTAEFNYKYNGRKAFLINVNLSGEGVYYMTYYENYNRSSDNLCYYPSLTSNAVDYWGYYNGRDDNEHSNQFLIPTTINEDEDEIGIHKEREPSSNGHATIGNLRTIAYPTGGSTVFEYEMHYASHAILKTSKPGVKALPWCGSGPEETNIWWGQFLNHIGGFYYKVGGVRIKQISNYDGLGNKRTKTYIYQKEGEPSSGGTLLYFPKYYYPHLEAFAPNGYNVTQFRLTYNAPGISIPANTFDSKFIEYNYVKEISDDNSYREYYFTDYLSNPDDYAGQKAVRYLTGTPFEYQDIITPAGENLLRMPNSRHIERGKLKEVKDYNSAGKLIRREEYQYERTNKDENTNYSTAIVRSGGADYSRKLFTYDYVLSKKITVDYFANGNGIDNSTSYTYNNLGQIIKVYNGRERRTDYKYYINEIPVNGTTSFYTTMKAKNLLSYPMEQYSVVDVPGGVSEIIGGEKYSYKMVNGGLAKLEKVEKALNGPYTNRSSVGYYFFKNYDVYDNQGNLLQTTNQNGVSTCFLWGYKGLYPVAVIQNTTISNINTALGNPSITSQPFDAGLTTAQVSKLNGINGSIIKTFSYSPFIGLTKDTDESGRSTTFNYNTTGKLSTVYDDKGIAVSSFEYSTDK